MSWKNKRILVTGGLGFIGSNLVEKLVGLGAKVTVIDDCRTGNKFNIEGVKSRVVLIEKDFADPALLKEAVGASNFVFHLAAETDHVKWRENPLPYVENNVKGMLLLLEAWRKSSNKPKIINAGTRGEYGPQKKLPVREDAPTNPLGLYELNKLQAAELLELYSRSFGLDYCHARITNVYGPRARMDTTGSGVVNWFVRRAMDDDDLPLFGGGRVKRDFIYVDDCVDALLALAESNATGVFNVGNPEPVTLKEAAEKIILAAGKGRITFAEYTPERKAQEPGDFYPSIDKIRDAVGWTPKITPELGLKQMVAYYAKNRENYW